ncbi:MAG: phage portal protein [Clostridiales bacterium]|nr:phage portal protein [Clostridiales bacterium]
MRAELNDKGKLGDLSEFSFDAEQLKDWRSYYDGQPVGLRSIYNHRYASGIKPNNFAPSGYPKYIVDIMAGYMGSPNHINYTAEDAYGELIHEINKKNHENTLTSKQIKQAGIYGVSYELHYLDKVDNKIIPRFADIPASQVVPVHDYTINKNLVAVIWCQRDIMRVYYKQETDIYDLVEGKWIYRESKENEYDDIQWVITQNNESATPTWLCVKNYVDIIDALQTNTLNALDRHARGTLITSLQGTDELKKNLAQLNAVFDMARGDGEEGKDFFEFVEQNLDPDLRETMLNHFINELHKISGIFDFTKLDLGQDPSGTALKYRIYPMELKAAEIVSYRQQGLEERYTLIDQIIDKMTVLGVNTQPGDLEISIERNIPDNIKAILEENNLMAGYVDDKTMIERVPGLDAEQIAERTKADKPEIYLDNA